MKTMKKSAAALTILFMCTIAQQANAGDLDPGGFVAIGAGASHYSFGGKKSNNSSTATQLKFAVTPVYSLEVGYRFNRYLRAGFNPHYRVIKFSKAHLSASSINVLVNVYLDLYNHSSFTPYVVGGAGLGNLSINKKKSSTTVSTQGTTVPQGYQKSSHPGVNWAIGAGVQAALSYNAGLDLVARYAEIGVITLQRVDATGKPILPLAPKQKVRAQDFILSLYFLL